MKAIINDVYTAITSIEKRWSNFRKLWKPFSFGRYTKWSFEHNIISILCYGPLLPFMVFGIYNLIKNRNKAIWFLVSLLFIHTLLHVLIWGNERYRIPIDSFVIILGCYGMIAVYDLIKTQFLLKGRIKEQSS